MQQTIEEAAENYVKTEYPLYIAKWQLEELFKKGVEFFKSQIKKDLLDAINHTDALETLIFLLERDKIDPEDSIVKDTVEKLKISLDNLRKLL